MSKLYFRYGAMNCGKSTAIIQVAHNYMERGMNAIIMKPKTDTKGGDKVFSRLGIEKQVDILVPSDASIINLLDEYMSHTPVHCVLVDEVQFFKKEQIDEFFDFVVSSNIPVICYGLRTDFLMHGFPASERLLLIAHSIEELKTICRCGKKALINARKINGDFVFEGEQIAIAGENQVEYESLCPKCYFKHKERIKNEH